MADTPRTPTRIDLDPNTNVPLATGTIVWQWTGLDGDDTGVPVMMGKHPDMTVQIYVATHGSATTTLEGTLDPRGNPEHADHANAVWGALTDTTETTISTTTTSLPPTQLLQGVMWVRPKTAGGTASAITVWLKGTVRG